MRHLTYRIALVFVILGLSCASAYAQKVKGTVKDASGQPVIGAAVLVEGTSTGTTVGTDGSFAINANVSPDAVLVVTSIGYKTVSVPVGNGTVDVVLEEDLQMLEETVVVGYGVQKKSVVTASISSITSEDLKTQSQTRVDNLLQGLSSGVVVTSPSGAPDAASQVRIRGIGSINDSNPLYIIDGFAVSGGIDYLNPNDIERIEILKDAASGAVYGARAANGVILVTTKQGQKGRTSVNYDFSYGWQNPWRKPSVLNATEFAIMMNEGYLNGGKAPLYDDPYSFGEGTDWIEEIFNFNAPVMKHDINISGGNDRLTYSTSVGYLEREGTVGGNYGRSNYDRLTARQTINATLFDVSARRNWLNKMTIGTAVSYAHMNATGIDANSEFGSPLGSAMSMSPLLSVYATEAEEEGYKSTYAAQYPYIVRDPSGRAYTVVDGNVYNEQSHPLAFLSLPGTKYDTDKFIINGAAELQLFDGLKFRSSVGIDLAFWGNHGYSNLYFLSSKRYNLNTVAEEKTYDKEGNETVTEKIGLAESASQEMNRSLRWQVENVLSYDKQVGRHSVAVILGQSAIRSTSSVVGASARGLMYPYDEWKITVDNTTGQQKDGNRNGWGRWNSIPYSLISYFGRVSYNFDERYMLEATMRADASSNFGPNNKWGYFPSVSAGWNAKNESFLKDIPWLSMMKVRGSWGINGNDNIGSFRYAVYMSPGNNYTFGSGANGSETISIGAKPNGLANPNAKWEQSIQTDIGVDLGFFGNRLTFTADYYKKLTSGMLMEMQVPGYSGDSAPVGNVGSMSNSGVEFDLGYRNHHGDLSYHASLNATYLVNELTELGDDATSFYGSSHKIGQLTRGVVGLPFPYFYGHKSDGIFQTPEEVAAHVNSEGGLLQPNAAPGDVRFVDIDNDGDIDDNDRTYIGKGTPDWSFGLNLGFEWKGIDFSLFLQGMVGNQVYNVSRRTDLYYVNLPKTILNRWTGEGTSDTQPRFMFDNPNQNYRASDIWVEDGSYLRARNIQLGYTIPQRWTRKAAVQRLRLYAQVENLFTLTKYTGCDPEVTGGNGFSSDLGIDRGVYPQSRTLTVGVNLKF